MLTTSLALAAVAALACAVGAHVTRSTLVTGGGA